ncbi:MAG: type II toxin-antitoxin system HicB family antitoxin [Saprospiraceae bacterium]
MSLKNKSHQFIAQIEFDKESNMYYGFVPTIPAVQTFATSIDQLHENLKEVLELCLEEMTENEIIESASTYIGTTLVTA